MTTSANPAPPGDEDAVNPVGTRRNTPLLGILLGAVLALATVAVYFALRGQHDAEITRTAFAAAVAQWDGAAPPNYDITVRVNARTVDEFHTEVRGGEVHSATRNGTPLTQARTLGVWSVMGMFDTIDADLALQAGTAPNLPGKKVDLLLRGRFDPTYGYPAFYRRIEWGAEREVEWEVTEFRVIAP